MRDTKGGKFASGRSIFGIGLVDVPVHRLLNCALETVHFAHRAFSHKFDSAVGEITHESFDIVTKGNSFGRKAETNSLYAPRKKNDPADRER